jgi:hypothetical protein
LKEENMTDINKFKLGRGTMVFRLYPKKTKENIHTTNKEGRQDIFGVHFHLFSLFMYNNGRVCLANLVRKAGVMSTEKWHDLYTPITFNGEPTYIAISWDYKKGKRILVNGEFRARNGAYSQVDVNVDQSGKAHIGYMQDKKKECFYNDEAGELELLYVGNEYFSEKWELEALIEQDIPSKEEPPKLVPLALHIPEQQGNPKEAIRLLDEEIDKLRAEAKIRGALQSRDVITAMIAGLVATKADIIAKYGTGE